MCQRSKAHGVSTHTVISVHKWQPGVTVRLTSQFCADFCSIVLTSYRSLTKSVMFTADLHR